MNTPLNDDTQQRARELARQITVAHDLDPEIQEELYGHIEDKLLAYKSGEERITDEDKDILARYRSGKSDCANRRLTISRSSDLRMTWFRQVVLLALATIFAIIAGQLLLNAYQWCVPWREFEDQALRRLGRSGAELLWWFTAPIFLLLILRRWGSESQYRANPWFTRISVVYLAAMTLFLIAVGDAITKILVPLDGLGLNVDIMWMQYSTERSFLARGMLCLIWMMWTYSHSRSTLLSCATGIMWALFYHLASLLPSSIAILAENTNQRLYASHWLGEIMWGQLRPDRLPEHAALYFAIIALCSLLVFLATREWRGIGRALRCFRPRDKNRSNMIAVNDGFVDGVPPSDEEALALVHARFGEIEQLRSRFQRVHLGVARALPMRRILALAIATLALCVVSDISGSALRLAAAMAVAEYVIPKSAWLPLALSLFDIPLIAAGLLWLLVRWNQATNNGHSLWFQRWPMRRMALITLGLFLLQLALPTINVAPKYALGGTVPLAEFFGKALMIPLLLATWFWWSAALSGGLRWIAAIGALFAPVMMVTLLQPLKIFSLIPRVLVPEEGANWIYLKSASMGGLNLDFYFAPDIMFAIAGMNLYALCLGGILLVAGLKELERELLWARHPFKGPSNASPPRFT